MSAKPDKESPDVIKLFKKSQARPVGRPRKADKKELTSIRFDADVIKKIKKYAADNDIKYQTLVNDVVATYTRDNLGGRK